MPLITDIPDQIRMPNQPSDIAPGSPMAFLAVFTEIVRERFRPGNGLAWVWSDDLTGDPAEAATPANPRKLMIVPSYSKHAEVRNYRPAIYVDRGDVQAERIVLGNMAGKLIQHGTTGYIAHASLPIEIEIVASSKGESATIADAVWFYLSANRDIIRGTLGVRDVTLPVLGRTEAGTKDRTEWVTRVRLVTEMTMRWLTKPMSPKLREVLTQLVDQQGNSFSIYTEDGG